MGLQRLPNTKCDTEDLISVFNTRRALCIVHRVLYIATSRHGNKSHTQSGDPVVPVGAWGSFLSPRLQIQASG